MGAWATRGWKNRQAGQAKVRDKDRFWVKPGGSGRIVFLDEDPFGFFEHQLNLRGSWRNYFTCLENLSKDCPLCSWGDDNYYVSMLTVGDLWQGRDGETRFNKKLFPMKSKTWNVMAPLAEKKQGLRGWVVECIRGGEKDPTVGSQFDFERRVTDLAEEFKPMLGFLTTTTPEEYLKGFSYETLFAPKSVGDLEKVIRQVEGRGYGDEPGNGGQQDQDDIPF